MIRKTREVRVKVRGQAKVFGLWFRESVVVIAVGQ